MGNRVLELDDLLSLRLILGEDRVSLSPSGRYVAYTMRLEKNWSETTIEWFASGAPRLANATQLWITDLSEKRSFALQGEEARSWHAVWSPTEDKLAFLSDTTGVVNAWSWDPRASRTELISSAAIFPSPRRASIDWSPDGKQLFTLLQPEEWRPGKEARIIEPGEEPSSADGLTVQVFSFPSEEELNVFQSHLPENFPDVGVIDLSTGDYRRLLRKAAIEGFSLSPDGHWLLLEGIPRETDPMRMGKRESDLLLMRSSGEMPRILAEGLEYKKDGRRAPAWSRDSERLTYIDREQIYFASPKGNPQALPADLQAEDSYYSFLLWDPPQEGLLLIGKRQSGRGFFRVLMDGTVIPLGSPARGFSILKDRFGPFSVDDESIVILAQNSKTRRSEFLRVPLEGQEPEVLVELDLGVSSPAVSRSGGRKAGGVVIFAAEDMDAPPDFYETDLDFATPRKITALNPQIGEARLGTSRRVSWIGSDGEDVEGVIILPPDFREGEPVPVVVEVYPGALLARHVHTWSPSGGTVSVQLLSSRGFGVFLPDMAQQGGYPVARAGLIDVVLSGLNELIRLDIADPNRLGVMGQSAGGLMVNKMITETTRFKAAVCSSGPANLSSMYGHFRVLGSGAGYSLGQELMEAGLGGPPWEIPHRYVEASPIFHLDKVKTPLLLIHGTGDPGVDVGQAAEMFVGLRRLGKKVTFLRYIGEGHVPGFYSHDNRRDLTQRVIGWFEEHMGTVASS